MAYRWGRNVLIRQSVGVIAAMALVFLPACSSPVPTTTDENPIRARTVAPEADLVQGDEAVAGYMKALEGTDPETMRAGRKFAVEDSIADGYLLHQTYITEAYLDAGNYNEPYRITRDGDGYKSCISALDGSESCAVFSGFKTKDGKVTEFLVDGEEPGSRLVMGNGRPVRRGSVQVELLSAYKSIQTQYLVVALKVTTGNDPIDLGLLDTTYRAPNGKQRKSAESIGPESLDADSNAIVGAVFPGVPNGGKVRFNVCIDYCDQDLWFNLVLGSD